MENDGLIYKVAIAPAANDRMYGHFEFLAQISKPAAEKLLDGLVSDIQSLERHPYRNPVYNHPYIAVGKYRYMMSCKRYRIVCQIEDGVVFVDDIQDCRQPDDKSPLFDS